MVYDTHICNGCSLSFLLLVASSRILQYSLLPFWVPSLSSCSSMLSFFVMVIGVLIKHIRNTRNRTKEQVSKKKTAMKLLISMTFIMFLFGLTWLFGGLTVTGVLDSNASIAFQVLFVLLNAFQGFYIFLFFCVFSKDARESWLELLCCGHCKFKLLHPLQAKYGANTTQKKKE